MTISAEISHNFSLNDYLDFPVAHRSPSALRFNNPLGAIAEACEEILLSSGMSDEAYARYAIVANRGTSHLATFRAIAKKYAHKTAAEILRDLVEGTPGEEGKWFASAKSAGLFEEAIALANKTPCDPRTLTRAAKEAASEHPSFAVEAGMAALRWRGVRLRNYLYGCMGCLPAYDGSRRECR